jgi:phosphoribosyl-dephospho-CoA transferase
MQTHALLRIANGRSLQEAQALPPWAWAALRRAPWVVVRRAAARDGLIPVGVRGLRRSERHAAWLHREAVLDSLTPLELAARRDWLTGVRRASLPALAALEGVASIMREHGLGGAWGPCGSVGFELASGVATATVESDLDLMVQPHRPLADAAAAALLASLGRLAVRTDVLLELPHGAVALAEYASAAAPLILRTPDGPRLVRDPWMRSDRPV